MNIRLQEMSRTLERRAEGIKNFFINDLKKVRKSYLNFMKRVLTFIHRSFFLFFLFFPAYYHVDLSILFKIYFCCLYYHHIFIWTWLTVITPILFFSFFLIFFCSFSSYLSSYHLLLYRVVYEKIEIRLNALISLLLWTPWKVD